MRTLAILPIKSLEAAKQRLTGALGNGARQALAQAMFQDVLASLRRVDAIDEIAVVTANKVAEQAASGEGVRLLHDDEEASHSEAALIGVRYALEARFQRVLLVPGDTPLLDPGELTAMLTRAAADRTRVVVVPDRHGTGTNALLLSPPDAIAPAFGPGSCERHRKLAEEAGISCHVDEVPSLMLDVDTPEDFAELEDALREGRARAGTTRGALRQLERMRESQAAGGPDPDAPPVQVEA